MSSRPNFDNSDHKFSMGLSLFPKFGPRRTKKILTYFTNAQQAFNASSIELQKAGIEQQIATEFIEFRATINLDKETSKLQAENIKVTTLNDSDYPTLLKEIPDAPALLYYKGDLNCAKHFCLAVVGSRKYTSYGQAVTAKLVTELASQGLSIVSGLALGIDALAHINTLRVDGKAIAVLGSGVDEASIYPRTNFMLAQNILKTGGLILSEFPVGMPALKHHFPQRNRIVAGLARGVLIIEAALKSGAQITANLALDYNREVLAVPGSIFNNNSGGTNKLISQGAQVITTATDVLKALELDNIKAQQQAQKVIIDNVTEQDIAKALHQEPLHINNLTRMLKLDTPTINATLINMELKGYIRSLGGGNYTLA